MTVDEMHRLADVLARLKGHNASRFATTFPDCTPACIQVSPDPKDHAGFCRVLYRPHMAIMAAGAVHRERLFLAGSRTGKTTAASFEVTCHLTGRYPAWWTGRRFDRPITVWCAGATAQSTRDILQSELLGPVEDVRMHKWTGMIPAWTIEGVTHKAGGIADCLDQVWIKHARGGRSAMQFKAFDQGIRAFQGTRGIDLVWEDEECPADVYEESVMRTMTTNGIVIVTFTPLHGLTEFLQHYLESSQWMDVDTGVLSPAGRLIAEANV